MKRLTRCVCCGARMPRPFLDLGNQPLANSYHQGHVPLPRYPLAVAQCGRCTHRQLTVAVDPEDMFASYLYVSGTSQTLRVYFEQFADRIHEEVGSAARVLDIGCNDGSLLEALASRVGRAQGMDPAQNLGDQARSRGLDVSTGFWSDALARAWPDRHDAIIAMNVVAHVAQPLDFLRGCRRVLAPGGRVYVQTSQCDWVENGEFDCVYHEHLSYFTEASFRALAARAGLCVTRVEKVAVHGTSWLFTLTDPLTGFVSKAVTMRDWLLEQVEAARKRGPVVGYGAAAKGNTLLNYVGVPLDYIVDDNPLKWGLYTPGMDIPIRSPQALAEVEGPVTVLLLAWNFEEEIVRRIQELRPNRQCTFLRCFPSPKVYE